MADEKQIVLTREGIERVRDELDTLKNVTRKEVSEKIKQARSFGDLSENAEYDAAKNEQAEVEARIGELEHMLKFAIAIEDDEIDENIVNPGSHVRVHDVEFDEDVEYVIVGTVEADPENDKISFESPIGAALLHHAVGETVKAQTPGGEVEMTILEITR